jgi:hypothetical protein
MIEAPPNSPMQLLTSWHRRLSESQFAHVTAARRLLGRNLCLGVPVTALSAIVAAALFATVDSPLAPMSRIVFASITLAVAVMAGLQTFLRFAERAERHRVIAARYGASKRHAEQLLVSGTVVSHEELSALRKGTDRIMEEAPQLSQAVFRSIRKELGYATDSEADVVTTS